MTDERADRPAVDQPPTGQPFDYEIQFKALVLMAVGVLAVVLVAAFAMHLLYFSLKGWRVAADAPPPVLEEALAPLRTPGPKLLATPEEELEKMRAEDEQILGGYAWVDRAAGIASIPVERALELVAERGLPTLGRPVAGEAAIDGAEADGAATDAATAPDAATGGAAAPARPPAPPATAPTAPAEVEVP